mgnify:CR=1 FL=1
MNNKKIVAIVVTAIALAVVGATWWQRQHTGPSDVLVLHGNVDIRQVSLAFDGNGRVAEMRAQEGMRQQPRLQGIPRGGQRCELACRDDLPIDVHG